MTVSKIKTLYHVDFTAKLYWFPFGFTDVACKVAAVWILLHPCFKLARGAVILCVLSENTPEPRLSRVPDFTPMYVGETVKFTCTVNVSSGWIYEWYEDGQNIPSATGNTFSLTLSEGGNYSCKATRGEKTSTSHSAEIQLAVHGRWRKQKGIIQTLYLRRSQTVDLQCASYHQ